MRLRRTLSVFLGVLGTLLIGIIITLFLVFPRVINRMADLLGNMGTASDGSTLPVDVRLGLIHVVIALVIDLILFYFFVWRPTRMLRDSFQITGLVVRKGEGQAFIDTESVRQRVLNAIAKFTDIQHADVVIDNDNGRAVIRLNIITDLTLNGPQKKNEINREVRKVVRDQLGIEVSGKPTINFTLAPEQPPVPLIPAGVPPRETPASPPPIVTRMPEPEPEPAVIVPEPPKPLPVFVHENVVPAPEPIVHDEPVVHDEPEPESDVTEAPPMDTLPENDDDHPMDEA